MATASLPPDRPSGVRLAELVVVLSLGADLGVGQPMEHAMRQCLIALHTHRPQLVSEVTASLRTLAAHLARRGRGSCTPVSTNHRVGT